MTKFFDGLKYVGTAIVSPIKNGAHGVGKIIGSGYSEIKKGATTIHNDIKGITKGTYKIASGLSNDVGTGISNLTSPIGIIGIAVIVGAVLLISMNKK